MTDWSLLPKIDAHIHILPEEVHLANSGIPADDAYNHPLLKTAERLHLPVAIHCYPNGEDDPCAARQKPTTSSARLGQNG